MLKKILILLTIASFVMQTAETGYALRPASSINIAESAKAAEPIEKLSTALWVTAEAITQEQDILIKKSWCETFFKKHIDTAKKFEDLLAALARADSDKRIPDMLEKISVHINTKSYSQKIEPSDIKKLKNLLNIYTSITSANIYSPLYSNGDSISLCVNAKILHKTFNKTNKEDIFGFRLEKIMDILLNADKKQVSDFLKNMEAAVPSLLDKIYFVYDEKYNAIAISPTYKHPAVEYSIGAGGIRHMKSSLRQRYADTQKAMMPAITEAKDLGSSMLWKNMVARLPYEGVKTGIIPIEEELIDSEKVRDSYLLDIKSNKQAMLKRWAGSLADIGFFEYSVGGPDMGMNGEYIDIITDTVRQRYVENIFYELSLIQKSGIRIETFNDYKSALKKIEKDTGSVFLDGRQVDAMRNLVIESLKEDNGEAALNAKGPEQEGIKKELIDKFNMILGSIVVSGTKKRGALEFAEYSPTSYGAAIAVNVLVEHLKITGKIPQEKSNNEITIRIEGAGEVGGGLAYLLALMGYRIIAISDENGSVYKKQGFSMDVLREYYRIRPIESRSIVRELAYCADETDISSPGGSLRKYPADIDVPAASAYTINRGNFHQLNLANYISTIIEAANISFKGTEDMLHDADIPAVTGFIVNQGGVKCCFAQDYLRHMVIPGEIDIINNEKVKTAIYDMYTDLRHNVTYIVSAVLALRESNRQINTTQIANIIAIAIANHRAYVYNLFKSYKNNPGKRLEPKDISLIRDMDSRLQEIREDGSYMVDEKAVAIAATDTAWKHVIETVFKRLKIKTPAGTPDAVSLLDKWIKDISIAKELSETGWWPPIQALNAQMGVKAEEDAIASSA